MSIDSILHSISSHFRLPHSFTNKQTCHSFPLPGVVIDPAVHPTVVVVAVGRIEPVAAVVAVFVSLQGRGRRRRRGRGHKVGGRRVERGASHGTVRGGEDVVRTRPRRHRGSVGPASGVIIFDEGGRGSRLFAIRVDLPSFVCKGINQQVPRK